mgnify:CR=1 FL=1
MTPIEWLEKWEPGFKDLKPEERDAIMQFALFWGYFEAKVLDNNASSARIADAVKTWHDGEKLKKLDHFADSLAYFRQRYYENGEFTHHFEDRTKGLLLRKGDQPDLVKAVLSGQNDDLVACVTAVLIIVYRFRNNLMHGMKWAYDIRGQQDNFLHASQVLMRAVEIHTT